jgi:hypothetical protein
MNTCVKVGNAQYPASITGRLHDADWDDRQTKAIKLQMSYIDAAALFVDGVKWSIVQENEEMVESVNDSGETVHEVQTVIEEYDNCEYSLAGDITDHRDGFVTVKMGKLTDLEVALEMLLGGKEYV